MIECFCSNFAKTYFCQNQAKERFVPPLTESGQQGIDLDRVLGEDGNQSTFEPVLEFLRNVFRVHPIERNSSEKRLSSPAS